MGRGGAAFPTGRKWDAVAKAPARPHYVVCNADESEPGTFKDRVLMEGDPFAVLEGMTIAGFATGSERGYLYVRGEYPLATRRMGMAIAAARAAGLLGTNVMNAGFAFDVELRSGAGAYICGEETALFNSIEGKRGEPRNKPPFPVQAGLFGKPTVVNNVETLVNIPLILALGGEAYAGIGTPGSSGPKLFCVSGNVARPGVYEVDFGISLGEPDRAGRRGSRREGDPRGAARRRRGNVRGTGQTGDAPDLRGNSRGGRDPSARAWCWSLTNRSTSATSWRGSRRSSAMSRAASASLAASAPCGRKSLLQRLRSGRPIGCRADEMSLLKEIGQVMRDASICGLGQTASNAIESAFATLDPDARAEAFPMSDDSLWFRPPPRPSHPPVAPARPEPAPVDVVIDGQAASVPATVDDPGGMPVPGNRHAHALLPGKPHAGQRLPDLRGRARRRTHAGPGLLPAGRAGDGDPDRLAASAAVAQDGARVPRLIRGSLHGPPGPGVRGAIRRLPRALRAAATAVEGRRSATAASRAITTRPTGPPRRPLPSR